MPLVYVKLIDPLLSGARRAVLSQVTQGARVLDACCGTGDLARAMGPLCSALVGVDLDEDMIRYAQAHALEGHRFEVADVRALPFEDLSFDLVTVSMALHEMPEDYREPALAELLRVAPRVLALDYAAPVPKSPVGLGVRVIERLAGAQHYAGFCSFVAGGGLPGLAERCGLHGERHTEALSGCAELWSLTRDE